MKEAFAEANVGVLPKPKSRKIHGCLFGTSHAPVAIANPYRDGALDAGTKGLRGDIRN